MSEGPRNLDAADAGLIDLLAPIAVASPTGRAVQYEQDYGRIEEARREENAALPQGVWERDVKRADWAAVERLCIDVLLQRSKDLRVAAWLTEAWLQREGVAGLARGLHLLEQLSARFWRDLFPVMADGELGARLAPFEWLNRRIPVLVNLLPLVVDASQPERTYSWSNYLEAQRLEHIRLQDASAAQRSEAKGAVTLAQFNECQRRTDVGMLGANLAAIRTARMRLHELEATLTGACGREAPGVGRIRSVLLDLEAYIGGVLRERADEGAPAPPAPQPTPTPAATALSAPAVAQAPTSREAAYRDLARIAETLAEMEPHSPVPLVLQELVGWGALTLPEIQARLGDGGSDMTILLQVLGLTHDL